MAYKRTHTHTATHDPQTPLSFIFILFILFAIDWISQMVSILMRTHGTHMCARKHKCLDLIFFGGFYLNFIYQSRLQLEHMMLKHFLSDFLASVLHADISR